VDHVPQSINIKQSLLYGYLFLLFFPPLLSLVRFFLQDVYFRQEVFTDAGGLSCHTLRLPICASLMIACKSNITPTTLNAVYLFWRYYILNLGSRHLLWLSLGMKGKYRLINFKQHFI
jgi:hypothetical protein